MRIRVQNAGGRIETITLVPPVTITLGPAQNVISDASGMEHFFGIDDGYYDGWGMAMPPATNLEAAVERIARVEEDREIDR